MALRILLVRIITLKSLVNVGHGLESYRKFIYHSDKSNVDNFSLIQAVGIMVLFLVVHY